MLTFKCRKCKSYVDATLHSHRCPSCGKLALRPYKTQDYIQQATAPSHKLKPYPNFKESYKGDF